MSTEVTEKTEITAEVVKIRIDSLQHTRQLITILVGGLVGIYTLVGLNQSSGCALEFLRALPELLPSSLLAALLCTGLFFLLSIYLLTDSRSFTNALLDHQ